MCPGSSKRGKLSQHVLFFCSQLRTAYKAQCWSRMDLYIHCPRLYYLCQNHHLLFYPKRHSDAPCVLRFSLHPWFKNSRYAICGLCYTRKSYVCDTFGSLCSTKRKYGLYMVCSLLCAGSLSVSLNNAKRSTAISMSCRLCFQMNPIL
jgi:hypothetical protein